MTMVTDRQQAKKHVYGCQQALEQGAEEWQWQLSQGTYAWTLTCSGTKSRRINTDMQSDKEQKDQQ